MSAEFDLNFSEEGLLSRVLFLTSETTLTVFVEDIDKEYVYEELFEKIFPPELKIDCIFPTGGKPKLEEAFSLFGSSPEYGKTFFIADGDFDLALGKFMIKASNFIYLKRYNIESYLLNETAVLKYMRPRLQKSIKATRDIIKYQEWIKSLSPYYNKLFALHYIVQSEVPEIKNVARNPARFLNERGYPNESQFNAYLSEVKSIIPDASQKIDIALQKLIDTYGLDTSAFVCGKYYIYALKLLLNTKLNKKINEDEVKAFLISNIDVDSLYYIRNSLINYIIA